jgi:hypothetical protein
MASRLSLLKAPINRSRGSNGGFGVVVVGFPMILLLFLKNRATGAPMTNLNAPADIVSGLSVVVDRHYAVGCRLNNIIITLSRGVGRRIKVVVTLVIVVDRLVKGVGRHVNVLGVLVSFLSTLVRREGFQAGMLAGKSYNRPKPGARW